MVLLLLLHIFKVCTGPRHNYKRWTGLVASTQMSEVGYEGDLAMMLLIS